MMEKLDFWAVVVSLPVGLLSVLLYGLRSVTDHRNVRAAVTDGLWHLVLLWVLFKSFDAAMHGTLNYSTPYILLNTLVCLILVVHLALNAAAAHDQKRGVE
jgi:hypothetical protein